MRLGLSFWGLLADFDDHRTITVDTPDGHRYGRPLLVKELQRRGHTVHALQARREPEPYPRVRYAMDNGIPEYFPEAMFPDLDIIFLEWRWSTAKNDARHPQHVAGRHEPDLDRQRQVIEKYRGRIPIIAWDTDLKITLDDEAMYPELILADPSLRPRKLLRDRTVIPFWSDWNELLPVVEPYPIHGYVGNRYERDPEFEAYYFKHAAPLRSLGIQTMMYGNWLQPSPERGDPRDLIKQNPCVGFNHRMNFYDSMSMMNRFISTTHVSKPEYYGHGFISPRYLEALAVNCPANVPFSMRDHVPDELDPIVAHRVGQVVGIQSTWTLDERRAGIENDREALKRMGVFDVGYAVDIIESIAKKGRV